MWSLGSPSVSVQIEAAESLVFMVVIAWWHVFWYDVWNYERIMLNIGLSQSPLINGNIGWRQRNNFVFIVFPPYHMVFNNWTMVHL